MTEPYYESPPSASDVAPVTTMAMAMLFGSVMFAFVSLSATCYTSLDAPMRRSIFHEAMWNKKSKPLDLYSFTSILTLLYHTSVFGLILFYAYICEYHPPYPHSPKSYDRDFFFFLTILLFVVSAFTLRKHKYNEDNDKEKAEKDSAITIDAGAAQANANNSLKVAPSEDNIEVLNRDQTEEWKGWMQFMFLLYHYYHAEEVYNAIRIMITCYVWMTGFGNFSFFYIKGDYSFVRVIQMLWRLNFLVTFLCLTQGATYILYYICLLHTFFFLMVYVSMRIGKQYNYTKWAIRQKLAVLAVIIFFIWDLDLGLFQLLHYLFLSETPMMGASSGSMWEWYFRSSLDHWSTFLGMIFALNFPITSLFFRKLDAQPIKIQILTKGSMGVILLAAFYWWATGPFMQAKLDYNATNAYFGFIPLIAYIYIRNSTKWLRCHSLELLHQIGKTTLETYLMQHHIWLTSNAKSLLTLFPGHPKMNFLLVTVIYFIISRRLYQLTLFLRGMILPNNKAKCISQTIQLAAILCAFVALAYILKVCNALNLTVVGLLSWIFGLLLYRVILDKTGQTIFPTSGAPSSPSSEQASSSSCTNGSATTGATAAAANTKSKKHAASIPLLYGTIVIGMFGLFWHTMANMGAGKIQPLHQSCSVFVNDGSWAQLGGCTNEESRGKVYLNHDISSIATCAEKETFVWGWHTTPSNSHCRFEYRPSKTLKKTLTNRKIVFVGDSEVRHMYHSLSRQMGESTAGQYDTSLPKQSNMERSLGSDTQLEFVWAAFVKDQVEALKQIVEKQKQDNSIDLLLLSSGPWDRLHNYSSKQEKEAVDQSVKELVILMKDIEKHKENPVPIVWLIPTTINSDALLTDEKKENLKEEHVQEIRQLYDVSGVLEASTFVLDGPAFTNGPRLVESYDGVHYPLAVYDAGAQILANAFDWLLLPLRKEKIPPPPNPPKPGKMAQPLLGIGMLCLVFIGLFAFDGFMGASYVVSLFLPNMMPLQLFEEAFLTLHREKHLPEDIQINDTGIQLSDICRGSGGGSGNGGNKDDDSSNDDTTNNPKRIKAKYSDDEHGIMMMLGDTSSKGPNSRTNSPVAKNKKNITVDDDELVQLLNDVDKN